MEQSDITHNVVYFSALRVLLVAIIDDDILLGCASNGIVMLEKAN